MFTRASLTLEEASFESCMMPSGETPRQAGRLTSLLMMKGRTIIRTWNDCIWHGAGRATQVANEMHQNNIKVLAICESIWKGASQVTLKISDNEVLSRTG